MVVWLNSSGFYYMPVIFPAQRFCYWIFHEQFSTWFPFPIIPSNKLMMTSTSTAFLWLAPLILLAATLLPAFQPHMSYIFSPFNPLLNHTYSTEIVAVDPLSIYIDGFLSAAEVSHVLSLGETLYGQSLVIDESASETIPRRSKHRISSSAFLPGNDTIVAKIKARAASFCGLLPYDSVEVIQLVRYSGTDKINMHTDWYNPPIRNEKGRLFNRFASFFIYIDGSCTAGETWFPDLPPPRNGSGKYDTKFKTHKSGQGLAVIPRAGSGLFWMNLREDGTGDERSRHAGMPVGEGTKVGMNIFVRKYLDWASKGREKCVR